MPRQSPAPVDVDLSTEDFMTRHACLRSLSCCFNRMESRHRGSVKRGGRFCACVVLGVKRKKALYRERAFMLNFFVKSGCGGLNAQRLVNSAK
ncbi:hypothetical protein D3C71_1646100 [compost metagenome]